MRTSSPFNTASCLAIVLLLPVVAVAQLPRPLPMAPPSAPPEVSFNVSLFDTSSAGGRPVVVASNPWVIRYTAKRTPGLSFDAELGYLTLMKAGGPIAGSRLRREPFEWDFPALDIKLTNNSKRTLFFSQAVLRVDSSRTDFTPILLVDENPNNFAGFFLSNEGWGPAVAARVSYNLLTPDAIPSFDGPFAHTDSLGDIAEFRNVSIANALVREGVDLGVVGDPYIGVDWRTDERIKRALGRFANPEVRVAGILQFNGRANPGETHFAVKFVTRVWILKTPPLVGAPRPPSYAYHAMLQPQGNNYAVALNIAQEIKSGDTDRFTIALGAPMSSFHSFILELVYNETGKLSSERIRARIMLPRSAAGQIEDRPASVPASPR